MAPVIHNRLRRGGRTMLAAAGATVVLGLAGCSIDLSNLRPGDDEEPSTEPVEPVAAAPLVEQALADLAEYQGLVATGQIAASVGADVRDAVLTVADSGATSGTIRTGSIEADLISADGRTFIRALEDFWLDQEVFAPDFDEFGGNWVRASGEQAGIDPGAVLAPPVLAEILGGIDLKSDETVQENLDGTLTHRVDLAGERNRIWIDAENGQIKRIAIEELVAPDAESGPQVRLDLAEADTAAVEELYDGIISTATDELDSSRDARIEIGWVEQAQMTCEDGPDCTWSGTVHDASGTGSGTVAVRMDVTFSNPDIGDQTCSDNGSLEAGGTLDLSCNADYNIVSESQTTYTINGEAVLSTQGLPGDQKESMLEALEEQREATLSGTSAPTGEEEDGTAEEGN